MTVLLLSAPTLSLLPCEARGLLRPRTHRIGRLAREEREGPGSSPGSIVLVHGNGSEPVGVDRFLDLLRHEKGAIRTRNCLPFDLRESVRLEEERLR